MIGQSRLSSRPHHRGLRSSTVQTQGAFGAEGQTIQQSEVSDAPQPLGKPSSDLAPWKKDLIKMVMIWNRPPARVTHARTQPDKRVLISERVWEGAPPDKCGLPTCHRPIRSVFIDGLVQSGGRTILCPGCHRTAGLGLSNGRGTLWEKRLRDGKFVHKMFEPTFNRK